MFGQDRRAALSTVQDVQELRLACGRRRIQATHDVLGTIT